MMDSLLKIIGAAIMSTAKYLEIDQNSTSFLTDAIILIGSIKFLKSEYKNRGISRENFLQIFLAATFALASFCFLLFIDANPFPIPIEAYNPNYPVGYFVGMFILTWMM
jgi:hypothetical protein